MMFIGPIAEWLQDYWYPVTRAIWDKVFSLFGDLNISTVLKDYLTAIIFFLPAFVMCRKKTMARQTPWALMTALFIAPFMASILARSLEADLQVLFSAVTLWVIFPIATIVTALYIWNYDKISPKAMAGKVHQNTEQPPGRKRLAWFGVPVQIILILCGAFFVYDVGLLLSNPFPPFSSVKPPFWTDPGPIRSLLGLILIVMLIVAPSINFVEPSRTIARLEREKAEKSKLEKTPEQVSREARNDRRFKAILLVIGMGFALSSASVIGWFETLAMTALAYILILIVLRTPMRIIGIAATMAVILGSSYVVWSVTSAKTALESLL